jgi:hypothetical protein
MWDEIFKTADMQKQKRKAYGRVVVDIGLNTSGFGHCVEERIEFLIVLF